MKPVSTINTYPTSGRYARQAPNYTEPVDAKTDAQTNAAPAVGGNNNNNANTLNNNNSSSVKLSRQSQCEGNT